MNGTELDGLDSKDHERFFDADCFRYYEHLAKSARKEDSILTSS